jgi:DNA repair photolyase
MSLSDQPARTALRRGLLPDVFTNALYSCAPYRGCCHACAYCDGRAEKYYVEGDFARDLVKRGNLPELLDGELARLRERDSRGRRPLLSLGSGVTDAYQPWEAKLGLTRQVAEVLLRRGQPTLLITKSALVARDLDLWAELNRRSGFILLMSLALGSEAQRRRLEPGASSLDRRLDTLRRFADAGIATGLLAMPLLPGLSQDETTIRSIYRQAAQAGVSFIMPGGLTLRPGRQKEHYLNALVNFAPGLVEPTRQLYRENRPSGAPLRPSQDALMARIRPIQTESCLPWMLPHRVLRRMVPGYEALHVLFCQMIELYAARGVPTGGLRTAGTRYADWLRASRVAFNRRRSLEGDWLEREFRTLLAGRGWEELLGNQKLAAFSREVLGEGREFDYRTLRLTDAAR